jgi:arylsulfatase A-like enzyme
MRAPNILLIIADQLRADHLGCYGNSLIETPHIDSLAARGTRFDRFYAANPLCMPNRASLLTGRMPSLHGVRRNGIPLSHAERTFVSQLRDQGYQTALFGKAHFQHYGMSASTAAQWTPQSEARTYPGRLSDYENELIGRWRSDPGFSTKLPYYGFEHVELCLYHGDMVEGDYARWLAARAPELAARRGSAHALPDSRYQCRDAWRTRVPVELYSSAYIAERAAQWLEQRASAGNPSAPFFAMCSFPDPHHPLTPPGKYWDMYAPEEIQLPASFSKRSHLPPIDYIHASSAGGRIHASNHHPYAPDEREARQAIALTYGMISNIDDAIGRVLETLQTLNLSENTIVAFTSDHGDFMGDHGVMLKAPMHFQGLIRVPFVLADPRAAERASVVSGTCGTLDIAATLLDAADSKSYNGLQGMSLGPAARGASQFSGHDVLVESETASLLFGRPQPYKLRTLLSEQWRITVSNDPGLCELYDLSQDPNETDNLWASPTMRSVREALMQRLLSCMMEHAEASPTALSAG